MSQSKGSARWLQHPTLAPLRVLGLRSPSQQTATLDRLTHKPPLYHRRYPAQGELAATGLQPIRDPANPANTKERLGISTPWYCTYSVYCTRYVWCCTVLYCTVITAPVRIWSGQTQAVSYSIPCRCMPNFRYLLYCAPLRASFMDKNCPRLRHVHML